MSDHRLRKWLRDPLTHYLAIGLVLVAVYTLLQGGSEPVDDARLIEVGAVEIQWLHKGWQARWQRPPTKAELERLVDNHIRQEVLYRTGVAMGLDRDDDIIRRRIQQKIELMTEDLAAQAQPTEVELLTYLGEHAETYAIPERRAFSQIYINTDEQGWDAGVDRAERLLVSLQEGAFTDEEIVGLGDRFMLGHAFAAQSQSGVRSDFGKHFAATLFTQTPGTWRGPVESGYGLHLVRVETIVPGLSPTLAEVRDEVVRDYLVAVRDRARDETYTAIARDYTIVVDEQAMLAVPLSPELDGGGR